jgi:hypothetical protein
MKNTKVFAAPSCPLCGQEAETQKTQFGFRHEHCGLWSWNGRELAGPYTHAARKLLHDRIQEVSQEKFLSPFKIQHVLAVEMDLGSLKNFKDLSEEQCKQALELLHNIDVLLTPAVF